MQSIIKNNKIKSITSQYTSQLWCILWCYGFCFIILYYWLQLFILKISISISQYAAKNPGVFFLSDEIENMSCQSFKSKGTPLAYCRWMRSAACMHISASYVMQSYSTHILHISYSTHIPDIFYPYSTHCRCMRSAACMHISVQYVILSYSTHILHTFYTYSTHVLHIFCTYSTHILHIVGAWDPVPVCVSMRRVWF